jgi:hypothetical protein
MASKTILVDDLDGTELKDGQGGTVSFTYDGNEYSLDLSNKNKKKMDDALAPFIANATKLGGRRTQQRSGGGAARTDREQLQAMRSWARDHGYTVSDRGRVSQEIQEAYHAAN